jgi:hypothetical protein
MDGEELRGIDMDDDGARWVNKESSRVVFR